MTDKEIVFSINKENTNSMSQDRLNESQTKYFMI